MDDADRLARALGAKRYGRQYLCRCPAHDDKKTPSLTFWQGRTAIAIKCWTGCEPIDVIRALRDRGVWPGGEGRRDDGKGSQVGSGGRSGPSTAQRLAEAEADRNRALALAIWRSSVPAEGTLAQVYLEWRRGLWLDRFSDDERARLFSEVIRFHPHCPMGQERRPAMVALMRGVIGDQPRAIHRTFLASDCRKLGKAMMLGPAAATAIKLTPQGRELVVCEGVETALGRLALGDAAVWALGCASGLERFEPLPSVELLIVRADCDASGAGQRAGERLIKRWVEGGKAAKGYRPGRLGRDYADVAADKLA